MNGKGDKYRIKWSKKYADNYDKIFSEGDKSNMYILTIINSEEAIDRIPAVDLKSAKELFRLRKVMDEESFDKLYEVKKEIIKKR
jgi:hypothetical protein